MSEDSHLKQFSCESRLDGPKTYNNFDIEANDEQVPIDKQKQKKILSPLSESQENHLSSSPSLPRFPYNLSSSFSLPTSSPISVELDHLDRCSSRSFFGQLVENIEPIPADYRLKVNDHDHDIRATTPTKIEYSDEYLHPFLKLFEKQEMPKHVLGWAITIILAIIVISFNDPDAINKWVRSSFVALLLVGIFGLWNGNMIKKIYPILGHRIELVGYAFVFGAFYGLSAYFLWPELSFVPILLCILTFVMLGVAFCNIYVSAGPGS